MSGGYIASGRFAETISSLFELTAVAVAVAGEGPFGRKLLGGVGVGVSCSTCIKDSGSSVGTCINDSGSSSGVSGTNIPVKLSGILSDKGILHGQVVQLHVIGREVRPEVGVRS